MKTRDTIGLLSLCFLSVCLSVCLSVYLSLCLSVTLGSVISELTSTHVDLLFSGCSRDRTSSHSFPALSELGPEGDAGARTPSTIQVWQICNVDCVHQSESNFNQHLGSEHTKRILRSAAHTACPCNGLLVAIHLDIIHGTELTTGREHVFHWNRITFAMPLLLLDVQERQSSRNTLPPHTGPQPFARNEVEEYPVPSNCSILPVSETLQTDARRRKRVLPTINTTRAPSTFGARRHRSSLSEITQACTRAFTT